MSELSQDQVMKFIKKGLELMNCEKLNIPVHYNFDLHNPNIGEVRQYDNGFIELHFNLLRLALSTEWTWQECIAHELVHIKQCATKELQRVNGRMFWKGNDATDWCKVAMLYLRLGHPQYYRDLPWEAEAFEKMKPFAFLIQEAL